MVKIGENDKYLMTVGVRKAQKILNNIEEIKSSQKNMVNRR